MARRKKIDRSVRKKDEARRYSVRGVRRHPMDTEKFSKALLGLVLADMERQAQADHATEKPKSLPEPEGGPRPQGGATDV